MRARYDRLRTVRIGQGAERTTRSATLPRSDISA